MTAIGGEYVPTYFLATSKEWFFSLAFHGALQRIFHAYPVVLFMNLAVHVLLQVCFLVKVDSGISFYR